MIHIAPLGLGGVGIRHCYKHVAPLGLCGCIRALVFRTCLDESG